MPVTVTLPSDRELVVARSFKAPRALVYRAFTEPQLLKQWMTGPPGWSFPVCEMDFRVGGKYHYIWRQVEGPVQGPTEVEFVGEYLNIVPTEKIEANETFMDPDMGGTCRLTNLFVSHDGGQTTVTCHMQFESPEARNGAVASGMADGMESGYVNLDALLASLPN